MAQHDEALSSAQGKGNDSLVESSQDSLPNKSDSKKEHLLKITKDSIVGREWAVILVVSLRLLFSFAVLYLIIHHGLPAAIIAALGKYFSPFT